MASGPANRAQQLIPLRAPHRKLAQQMIPFELDLACGHGLLAHIMLLLDNTSPEAVGVDLRIPKSAEKVSEAMSRMTPKLLVEIRDKTGGSFYDLTLKQQCELFNIRCETLDLENVAYTKQMPKKLGRL